MDGDTYILYKPKGKSRTIGLNGEEALRQLKKGLHNPQMSFIYHCYNHYFCPIGYEDSPIKAADAYRWTLGDQFFNFFSLLLNTLTARSDGHVTSLYY